MAEHLAEGSDPLRVLDRWLAQAAESGLWRNPGAMAIATAGADGRPSVRMVLLKRIAAAEGFVVFYTHYDSRKGRELERNAWGAAALYWEAYGRQARIEGPVLRSPAAESDAYFATRPLDSRLNAWASRQSRPLDAMSTLERRADDKARELGLHAAKPDAAPVVPRPASWGGYRLWCAAVELWIEGRGRFHERIRYERELAPAQDAMRGGPWRAQRLQP